MFSELISAESNFIMVLQIHLLESLFSMIPWICTSKDILSTTIFLFLILLKLKQRVRNSDWIHAGI